MITRLFHQYYQYHGTVITRLLLLAGLATVAGTIAGQAQAAIISSVCASNADMLARYEAMFGERQEITATRDEVDGGRVVQRDVTFVVNPQTGTWTALIQRDPAMMCDVGWNGGNWTAVSKPESPKLQRYIDAEGRLRYFIPIGFR